MKKHHRNRNARCPSPPFGITDGPFAFIEMALVNFDGTINLHVEPEANVVSDCTSDQEQKA
jgi:hypothetical protein